MATIIITLILNLIIGTPTGSEQELPQDNTVKELEDPGMMSTMGGSGAWVNVEK